MKISSLHFQNILIIVFISEDEVEYDETSVMLRP